MARADGADRMMTLLEGDLASEVAKRWLKRHAALGTQASPSAPICQGLMSMLLRASLKSEAFDSHSALVAARKMPVTSPLERVGFSPTLYRQLPAVVEDLIESVLTQTPLIPANPALSFYSTAGVGATDETEYENLNHVPVGSLAAKRVFPPSAAPGRAESLMLALDCFAQAFEEIGRAREGDEFEMHEPSPVLKTLTRERHVSFWKVFLEILPQNMPALSAAQLQTLLRLYGGLFLCESVAEQQRIKSELANVFTRVCGSKPSRALGIFARMVPVPTLRMTSALTCLTTLMKTSGRTSSRALKLTDVEKPMDVLTYAERLVAPLFREKMDRRTLLGAPALLSAYTESWMASATSEHFVLPPSSVATVIRQLHEALNRLMNQTGEAVETDVLSTRLSILQVCARIVHVNTK